MNLTWNKTTVLSNYSSLEPSHSLWYESAYNIGLIFILVLSVFGETLLLIQLGRIRKQLNVLDILTVHMALMDLILVLTSIPELLVYDAYQSFQFGKIGCKLIHPLATCVYISKVLTLLAIAYQTWYGITSKTALVQSKQRASFILIAINIISITTVIPYVETLAYNKDQTTGTASCDETWSLAHRKIYTMALFLLQYGIPAPLMIVFYYLTWRKIFESKKNLTMHFNNSCAALLDDGEIQNATVEMRRISFSSIKVLVSRRFSQDTKTVLLSKTGLDSKRKQVLQRKIMSASFQGRVLISRQMQYKKLTKTFTLIVLVFLLFSLPNQLLWVYIDFGSEGNMYFNHDVFMISSILTYANCVLNPWIYGHWYRKTKNMCIFLLCFGKKEVDCQSSEET